MSAPAEEKSAIQRAREFGIDLTLLLENLRLTPTERLRKAQRVMDSLDSFRREFARWRASQSRPLQ